MNESKGLKLVANRQNPAHWHVLFGPHSVFNIWITCQTLRIRKIYRKYQCFLKGPPFHDNNGMWVVAAPSVHHSPWYPLYFCYILFGPVVYFYDLLDTIKILLGTPALMIWAIYLNNSSLFTSIYFSVNKIIEDFLVVAFASS